MPEGTPLAAGERVLLVIIRKPLIVATDRALLQQGCDGSGWYRLGWQAIDDVHFDGRSGVVTLLAPRANRPRLTIRLNGHSALGNGALPRRARALIDLIHERVDSTILLNHRAQILGGAIRIVARREPGTGRVEWIVGHQDHRTTRDQIAAAIDELRILTGL
ncbi:MAG TPA: hypothetical protein VHC49_09100 [Mycobacteriales bacterium]|nr:hypothetical protein [Mycobacteriales bacterium]